MFENFDKHPQGTFPLEKWISINSAINSLESIGIELQSNIVTSRYQSVHINPIINITYPGSECINNFESLELSHLQWLELLLLKGEAGDSWDINISINNAENNI